MRIAEYRAYDGIGLADLVRRKEVTPKELLTAAIELAEQHNEALNAIVRRFDELAKAQQVERNATFAGVPMLLKDLGAELVGVSTRYGCAFVPDVPGPVESYLVERFKKAGLVPFAKTNTPELGLLPTTEPRLYGPCRNPWNTDYITGGSSGGSSAAVAAGIVPIAHANDGGGSIRIPASCCGLVGMKPTRARNPLGPLMGDIMSGLAQDHVVTRTVRDSAAVLDATHGNVQGDPYWAPPASDSYLTDASTDPSKLRIGVAETPPFGGSVHADVLEGVRQTAETLAALGHEVEEVAWSIDAQQLTQTFMTIWFAGCATTIDQFARLFGSTPKEAAFEPLTWTFYQLGKELDASAYLLAVGSMHSMARQVAASHGRYDAVLMPTLGAPPLRLGEIDSDATDVEAVTEKLLGFVSFTPVQNMTGQPAVSLPLHVSSDGLPIGMMFVGRFGDEATLYRLAGQLERVMPWEARMPQGFWD